jgi:hypothetical protein
VLQSLRRLYRFLSPRHQTLFLDYRTAFQPRYGHGKPPHPELYTLIAEHNDTYRRLAEEALTHRAAFEAMPRADQPHLAGEPYWNNGFLPGLDIVMLYTLLRHYQPRLYAEVGSGNSTMVARKAIREGGLTTKILSIDPYPRADIDTLANEVLRQPLEAADIRTLPDRLHTGDILFIDNSHRCLPNSDVTVVFLELLPRLKPGVIVQIHDVYLPYDYPQFMCDRFYSEQYLLAAIVQANPTRYRPLFPAYYFSEDATLRATLQPLWQHPTLRGVETHGGSFWLEIGG